MADVYLADELPPEDAVSDLPTAGAGSGIGRLQKAALREAVHDLLTASDLADLGSRVVEDWNRDKEGNKDWREKAETALDAAAQEKVEAKNYPFVGAANVKYPLLTISSMAFSSRAVPAIIKGDEAIKVKTFGKANASEKQARADRVAEYLNYLLFYKVDGWEQDTDAMLVRLPAVGQHYRKVWWDPIKQRCCIESVSALRLVLPCDAKSLREAPRITHDYDRYPYELQRLMRSGHFREVQLQPESSNGDDQAPRVILEQHRYEDLNGDGLDEPYIVTVDALTAQVLRIDEAWEDDAISLDEETGEVLNIDRWMPFVDYGFIPDPKGRAYSIGFGHLLTPIMDVVNTNINLMIDAGHAQVAGGGFVGNEIRLQGAGQNGALRWQPGEWKNVNASGGEIRNAIFERTFPAPSPVLFELLGLLMDAAKDIASVNDAITGDASRNAPVGTTLALIEQGQQVFNAIYKRIYRGLREEFKLFADCVAKYGDPEDYAKFVDVPPPQMGHNGGPPMAPQGAQQMPSAGLLQPQQEAVLPPGIAMPGGQGSGLPVPAVGGQGRVDPAAQFEADFNFDDLDIRPISDPSAVTKAQQMAKMQLALTFLGQGIYADDRAVVRATLQAGGLEEADDWIPEQAPPNPMQEAAAKLQMALGQVEVQLKAAQAGKLQADAQVSQANLQMGAAKTQADVTLKGAQAAKIVDEIQGASAVQEARQALSDLETDEVDRQKKRAETAMTFMQPQLENEREERSRETAK